MAGDSTDQTTEKITTTDDTIAVDGQDLADVATEEVVAQADNPDAVRRALQAEREAAKKAKREADELRSRIQEFEDREKTEQQKLAEERDRLKEQLTPLQGENERLRVAIEKGLPGELIDRLQGETREELEEDADTLLRLFAKNGRQGSRGADLGAREHGGPKQVTEAELKTMRPEAIEKARKEGRLNDLLGVR